MGVSEADDPIELIRQNGADPQVPGRVWDRYRDRLRRVVRLRLDRFVNDEPVQPRRVGQAERFARWCRHHPAVAGLIAAVLVLMAAGTAVSTWQAVAATRAREDLAAKNAQLAAEQAKVQARFDTAVKAIETFHTGVSEEAILKNPEFREPRTKRLRVAARFYEEPEKLLAGQTDPKFRKTLATGYFQLGELMEKLGSQPEALAVHRMGLAARRDLAVEPGAAVETRLDVTRSLRTVARLQYNTGDMAGALRDFKEMGDIAAAVEAESPSAADRQQLAQSHYSFGAMLEYAGKPAEAQAMLRQALPIFQTRVDDKPAVATFQDDLADTQQPRCCARGDGELGGGAGGVPHGVGDHPETGGRRPAEPLLEGGSCPAAQQHRPGVDPPESTRRGIHPSRREPGGSPAVGRRGTQQPHVQPGARLESQLPRLVRVRTGQPAEAAADLLKALELWTKLSEPDRETQMERSRSMAPLAGLGADAKSGVTKDEAKAFAGQSVAALATLVKPGWARPGELREPDFDAVRGRADFQKLVAEVEAKAEKVPETARSPRGKE